MRVLLISANTETINMVPLPLGLNCVAVAARNAGHEVRMLDLMGSGDNASLIIRAIEEFEPEVVGISVRNVDNQQMVGTRFLLEPMRDVVDLCRTCSGAPVVVGGAGFSIFPEAMLRYLHADIGVCGEGEAAFTNLLDALAQGKDLRGIDGIYLPGAGAPRASHPGSLESLPLPDASLWNIPQEPAGEIWIPFQTRRGCPMRCSYCSTPALEGTTIRTHPVDAVMAAIRGHVEAGFDRFYFVDNTFNLPIEYAKKLCSALADAKLGIRWRCILYPGFVDEELVRLMAQAGCIEVSLGFESGSPSILKNLNKKYDLGQVREASELLKKHGIQRMGFLLLGVPGETRETVRESLEFADSLDLDMMKISIGIRIYPDTALEKSALEEGCISLEDDLLHPRFYLAKGLSGWLEPVIGEWVSKRPHCMM